MSNQFSPAVPPVPLSTEGSVLAMHKGCPAFVGGTTVCYSEATPIGIPPSGTFQDNGVMVGLQADFQTIYPAIYFFFPANAIFSGSQPGLYYTRMDSVSSGQVFNNVLSPGQVPVVIKNPVPFVSTGPGDFTQSTDTQNLLSFTVTGRTLRENGSLELYNLYSFRSNGNVKHSQIFYGGQLVQQLGQVNDSGFVNTTWIHNTGDPTRQIITSPFGVSSGNLGAPNNWLSVNTLNDADILINGALDQNFDFMVLEAVVARVVNPVGP